MKKFFVSLILICVVFCMCACSSTISVDDKQSTETPEISEEKKFKVGEEIFIKNDSGEYKFTITGVEETDYRNEFSDKSPNRVIIISYNYENISSADDLYISDMNFKAYDGDNNSMDTYPADVEYPDSVSAGRKSKGQMAYGLDSDKNYVELEYYDNMFLNSDCKIVLEW